MGILRRLNQADPGRHQPDLADALGDLALLLSDAGRSAEALSLTAEAVLHARGLAQASPDHRRLQRLALTLTEYGSIRRETGQQLPEALAALSEAEQLLRLPRSGSTSQLAPMDIGIVLGLRGDVLRQLGRREEALEAWRAIQADKGFKAALESDAKGIFLFPRLSQMAELEQDHGAEAIAVRMATSRQGSTERYLAEWMLKRRRRRERRADRSRLPAVPTTGTTIAPARPPDAASLLADITAHEAVDPQNDAWSRRDSAQKLLKLGDPRGTGILVAQTLDTGTKYFHREAAAEALIKAGDPRGRYLLADVLADRITDPRTGWFHRRAATDQLRALNDPRAEELSARTANTSAVTPAVPREARWQLAIEANTHAGLTGVSSTSIVALGKLSARHLPTRRSRGRKLLTGWLAGLLLVAPPGLMVLAGVSLTNAPHSHAGPGNWAALCVSAFVFYLVAHESMNRAGFFAVRAWRVGAAAKRYFISGYVALMPLAAVAGLLLAYSVLDFLQPAGKFLWDILIWR
jgi:tetratricopeptide (TPR) repeat protein